MNLLKILPLLAFGAVLAAGCAKHDDTAATTEAPAQSPATEPAPPPADMSTPSDTTGYPPDEPSPATSDTLPNDEQPPPDEPAPPPPNG